MLADPIAELRSPSGSLISVYLGRPSPGGMTALLTDLLRPVRGGGGEQGSVGAKSVRADSERIHDQAELLEVDAAPAYAIFASDLDGLFTLESLGHHVPNVSSLGPRPYLRPLRAAPKTLRARRHRGRSLTGARVRGVGQAHRRGRVSTHRRYREAELWRVLGVSRARSQAEGR